MRGRTKSGRGSGCQSWQFFSEVRSESKVGASSLVDRAPAQARSVMSAGTRLSGAVYPSGCSGCFCTTWTADLLRRLVVNVCTVQGIKLALIASRSTNLAPCEPWTARARAGALFIPIWLFDSAVDFGRKSTTFLYPVSLFVVRIVHSELQNSPVWKYRKLLREPRGGAARRSWAKPQAVPERDKRCCNAS